MRAREPWWVRWGYAAAWTLVVAGVWCALYVVAHTVVHGGMAR